MATDMSACCLKPASRETELGACRWNRASLLMQLLKTTMKSQAEDRTASWAALKRECDERGIRVPSYVTFCLAVQARPAFEQTLKRQRPTRGLCALALLFRVAANHAAPWRPPLRNRSH